MKTKQLFTYLIALVWLINGLFCKVLNFVPRHEQIVAEILGQKYSSPLTLAIGLSEILMTIWIVSGYKQRLSAITQIIVIATMNILELILAPDLLLWGPFNTVFALLFIGVIYYNEFKINKD